MAKLFIQPPHGKLGETLEALKNEDFLGTLNSKDVKVELVGWGYPPMFVELDDEKDIPEVKRVAEQISEDVDDEVKFESYRADLIDEVEILQILKKHTATEMSELIIHVKEIRSTDLTGSIPQQATQIIEIMQGRNKLAGLVDAVYKNTPHYF